MSRLKAPTGGGPGATGAGPPPVPSLAALVAAALALLSCTARPPPPAPARTLLGKVTYSEFVGSSLARRIRADELQVVPKRFGHFAVPALSEIWVTRARVELFEPPPGSAAAPRRGGVEAMLPSGGLAIPGLASMDHFAGATFYGLEVVIRREQTQLARVAAGLATADMRTGNLQLRDFRVEVPGASGIVASRGTWRRGTDDILIPGDYYVVDAAGGRRSGHGLRIDLLGGGPPR